MVGRELLEQLGLPNGFTDAKTSGGGIPSLGPLMDDKLSLLRDVLGPYVAHVRDFLEIRI